MSDPGRAAAPRSDVPSAPAARGAARTDVRAVLAAAAAELEAAGVDSPRLDAELLLGEALGVSRAQLVIDARQPVAQPALARFYELLRRRVAREPVAYILGRREFRRLELTIDSRALVPRPETELLVEVGLTLPTGSSVVDVGTGSGAVALALADERRDLRLTGTDISPDAVALARENAQRLGLDVSFVCGDLRSDVESDAVLANLPYVPDGTELAPEIVLYEPAGALFGGADGLDLIRRLVAPLGPTVSFVGLEHGFDQGAAVRSLLAAAGFSGVRSLPDLAGLERVTVGRRS